jgi:HSP20 family protein
MLNRSFFPTLPLGELRRELDRAFNDVLGGWDGLSLRRAPGFPAINLWEDGEALYAEAEVPGVGMDSLEILAVGNELTLKGQRRAMADENFTFHRRERGVGEFTRVITLPAEVDTEKVEATLRDGVLSIVMPKSQAARARKIQVKAQ